MRPRLTPKKESNMFDGLKRYKVVKEFNGYRKGICVAFSGADAEKYAAYIVSMEKAQPVVVEEKQAPVVEKVAEKVAEVVEAKPKRKVVRRGKK